MSYFNQTTFKNNIKPITCISKTLLELHLQSVIDFSKYEYIKIKNNEMSWHEIGLKILLCMIR